MSETILIADDAELNRELLKDIFDEQFNILEAEDGDKAIEMITSHHSEISLIFLDLIMPNSSGIDVLNFLRQAELSQKIPVIMITGEGTEETDDKAYEYGVDDIIYKPFSPRVVMHRTHNLIEQYRTRNKMEEILEKRTQELRETQERLAKNNEFLINALGSVIEFRNRESYRHVQRVKIFTKILLKNLQVLSPEYNLSDEQISMIASASALHDIGKIGIPDKILMKEAPLTSTEMAVIRQHPIYGCQILEQFHQESSQFYKYCYEICRWHHEKYDGNGYPDRLSGENIPIWAQAASISDCFEALISKRVYKDAVPFATAMDMINRGECGMFSSKILNAFNASKLEILDAVLYGCK